MTGNARRSGPPWSVDLLADLHAGLLDPREEAELRPLVEADPEAKEVLAALDATVQDLRDLPPLRMPDNVASRIDAALAEEARRSAPQPTGQPVAPVVDLAARRRKRLGWGAGLLTAAAAAVGLAVMVIPNGGGGEGGQQAQPPATTPSTGASADKPLAVRGNDFGPVLGDVLKAQNYGPLENQEKLAGCLRGANIVAAKPIGVSPITLDDKPAVMAVLPRGAGTKGQFRIVVLDPATCGPDNPDGVLADSPVGPN
ncbi:anti-sigma factor family protein [Saccharothrix coeruleofusca]|uniref:Anti-sigma-M factor RsmA n=1 Tax=Saccharothrix coeruleofusca TaxID=33919 RepID=A0A918AIZ6_9PSEU|nr:hypothetical protein [Saccharothrix coeruleofusca]MBP2339936.1 hypothetical protein [Saccharothrix coeruleofusca]GGP38503.1 hypothetical protein GCM10010185_07490 [Saccharothrix coeruleofusca]